MTNSSSCADRNFKRRKIQVACTSCRDRKQRCTGSQPCASCEKRGLADECSYDETAWRTQLSVSAETIYALEQRVARLEQSVSHNSIQQFNAIDRAPRLTSPDVQQNADQLKSPARNADSQSGASRDAITEGRSGLQDVDGLVTVASPENITEERFFGRSSTIGFLRHLTHFAGSHGPTSSTEHGHSASSGAHQTPAKKVSTLPPSIQEVQPSSIVYPPRMVADDYIHSFWEYVYPVFPILHKPSFMSEYHKLWVSRPPPMANASAGDLLFPSTLNIVFALGCQYSQNVKSSEKSSVASEFYRRARQVAAFDMLDSMSMPFVQHLLLTGVYLQSTSSASTCWNSVGLAIRVAQSLGLDLEHPRARSESQIDREMRRRVWHVCTLLDRLLAMTFGRPPMVSTSRAVPLPLMVDDEYLKEAGEGVQPPDLPPRLGLLSYSSQLLEIVQDVLKHLYQDSKDLEPGERKISEQDSQKTLTQALELNDRLDRFVKDIPEYLHPDVVSDLSYVSLQQRVLFCRHCMVRILILRPILLTTIEQGRRNVAARQTQEHPFTLMRHLIKGACDLCVDTAHELIESLWLYLENTYRSSSWHTVYFAFNAAVILLAAKLSPVVGTTGVDRSHPVSWEHALAVLERYRQQLPSAALAIQTLQSFQTRIDQRLAGTPVDGEDCRDFVEPELTTGTAATSDNPIFGINFDDFDYGQFGSINDTWFSQQVVNTDWFGMIHKLQTSCLYQQGLLERVSLLSEVVLRLSDSREQNSPIPRCLELLNVVHKDYRVHAWSSNEFRSVTPKSFAANVHLETYSPRKGDNVEPPRECLS